MRNVLNAFDDFDEEAEIIDKMRFEDYKGWYNTYYEEFRKPKHESESINDDIEFEMELVKQVQVNIHYILQLVQKYHDKNCEDKEIIVQIRKQVEASPDMRDKRDLIEKFIERMTPEKGKDVGDDWEQYIEQEKKKQLDTIIKDEDLDPRKTEAFMKRAFADGYVTETGTGIAQILPPVNPFLPESGEKKQTVIEKLKAYLSRFSGIIDEYVVEKRPKVQNTVQIQLVPDGSKLHDVEADDNVRSLIHNMMELYEGTTILRIVAECQKEFGEKYFSMSRKEWHHLIRDYVRDVTERPDLQEEEMFRYVG